MCRIINPLAGFTRQELSAQVSQFCAQYELADKEEYFQKGALVAQSPDDFENIPELTEDDKHWIRREKTRKKPCSAKMIPKKDHANIGWLDPWSLPKDLYYTIAVCSLGAAIQGWDNTGANGANLSFPEEFGIANNEWLVGFVNSAYVKSEPTHLLLLEYWIAG